jgi:hypothetical protein
VGHDPTRDVQTLGSLNEEGLRQRAAAARGTTSGAHAAAEKRVAVVLQVASAASALKRQLENLTAVSCSVCASASGLAPKRHGQSIRDLRKLQQHAQTAHQRSLCTLCREFKKVRSETDEAEGGCAAMVRWCASHQLSVR